MKVKYFPNYKMSKSSVIKHIHLWSSVDTVLQNLTVYSFQKFLQTVSFRSAVFGKYFSAPALWNNQQPVILKRILREMLIFFSFTSYLLICGWVNSSMMAVRFDTHGLYYTIIRNFG